MNKLKGCSSSILWIFSGKSVKIELHSVFKHVLNMVIQEQMISLVSADIPWSSLCIQTENPIDFLRLGIDVGNKRQWQVIAQLDKIRVGNFEFLKTSDFAVFDACIRPIETERLSVIKETAAKVIGENKDRGFARAIYSDWKDADLITKDLRTRYLSIRAALKTRDKSHLESACVSLLGAGAGLTPSGDDFLCGMLQILWALENVRYGLEMRSIITGAIEKKLYETCDISRAYLLQSLRGYAGELMQGLLSAANEQECREYMDYISKVGHSSGIDLLCGVWMILDTLV